jgi:hypothetical protein
LPLEVASALVRIYTEACNFASEVAFRSKRPSSKDALNRLSYEPLRARYGLSAQITQSAVRAVAAKYTALKKLKRTPNAPVCFREEPVQLQGGARSRDFGFTKDGKLSLSTLSGRVKVGYQGPPRPRQVPREDGAPSVAPEVPGSPGQAHAIPLQG